MNEHDEVFTKGWDLLNEFKGYAPEEAHEFVDYCIRVSPMNTYHIMALIEQAEGWGGWRQCLIDMGFEALPKLENRAQKAMVEAIELNLSPKEIYTYIIDRVEDLERIMRKAAEE